MNMKPASEAPRRHELIASDRVQGTTVYDASHTRIGTLDHFMVSKISGQVAYAVISLRDLLGESDRVHPVPWHALSYDIALSGYVVSLDRPTLEASPHYDREELERSDLNEVVRHFFIAPQIDRS